MAMRGKINNYGVVQIKRFLHVTDSRLRIGMYIWKHKIRVKWLMKLGTASGEAEQISCFRK